MERGFRPILNTDRIGSSVEILLPGFPYRNKVVKEPCSIHYLEYGEGEPLLLVHSIGQSIYTWRNLMPLLAGRYRVIAFDLCGFGFSGRPDSMNYSMDEVADAILWFMDAIQLQRTHLLGFSFGAVYALEAAVKAPERFAKKIALQPGGVTKQMPKKVRRMQKSVFGALVRESYGKKHVQNLLRSCFYDATAINRDIVGQYYETMDDFASRQAIMYSLRNFDLDESLKRAAAIADEVLVLWAAEDRLQPPENMNLWKKSLRKGVYHTIRNAGHLMHEEKAEQLADIVDRYIQFQGENV
ncbi:MAG: alpha/beta hydrolase [Clostridia bacterium]|nr:alpha/beta hydrolase [Clostridia bacterium]